MTKCRQDIYDEPIGFEDLIADGISSIKTKITSGCKVLDVGCGNGKALEIFKKYGAEPTGITLNENEIKGNYDIRYMDMSFLEFEDDMFDIIWARHSLEHSIFPLVTLTEWNRVLKQNGILYLEVPAPNTSARHEFNKNHYSVIGYKMCQALLEKANFRVIGMHNIEFMCVTGKDLYYRIWAEKHENNT